MDLLEKIFDDTFNSVYQDLMSKRDEGFFTKEDLTAMLDTLYANEGCSQSGKSDIQQKKLSASIAAHESAINDWDK